MALAPGQAASCSYGALSTFRNIQSCSYSRIRCGKIGIETGLLGNQAGFVRNQTGFVVSSVAPAAGNVFQSCPGIDRLVVRDALCEGELSASAFLRSRSFYMYPEGRSFEAQEIHQRFMAALECKTLMSKLAGTEAGYNRVTCLIALLPLASFGLICSVDDINCLKVRADGQDHLVVGTLDLNQGRRLPGEMQGSRPKEPDSTYNRAYISNFCVALEARRRGVGSALVTAAKKTAKEWGVSDLYVHVVATNEPAVKLYTKCGFTIEGEETLSEAHLLARPRRMLLWQNLTL